MSNVVIVVDMLKGFHNIGALANPRIENIIPNIRDLLEKKTQEGWKLIFLRDYHDPNDKEFEIFPSHCVKGTPETEFVDELQEFVGLDDAMIINKTRYSGFFNTSLAVILRRENPEQVIVVGVCTDICVLHTVAGLRNRDYRVIVFDDCVETFDALGHPAWGSSREAIQHMRTILGAEIKYFADEETD